MIIALATDDRYAMACGICVTSIIENNVGTELSVHILTSGLSKTSVSKFREIERRYGVDIDIVKVDTSFLSGLKVSTRFPLSIYYRILLPQILRCDKVLYLDCDIIVNGSLSPLWGIDVEGIPAVVVEDQCSDDILLMRRIRREGPYFNSGVMLLNLDYWRTFDISRKCVDFLSENRDICIYPDQDAMNCIIGDHVRYAEFGYNFQELMFAGEGAVCLDRAKWEKIQAWKASPVVVHYTGYLKPWHLECAHPMTELFLKYKALSPWADSRLVKYYGLKERISRKIRKFKNSIFR